MAMEFDAFVNVVKYAVMPENNVVVVFLGHVYYFPFAFSFRQEPN